MCMWYVLFLGCCAVLPFLTVIFHKYHRLTTWFVIILKFPLIKPSCCASCGTLLLLRFGTWGQHAAALLWAQWDGELPNWSTGVSVWEAPQVGMGQKRFYYHRTEELNIHDPIIPFGSIRAPGFCPTNLPNCLTSWCFESILATADDFRFSESWKDRKNQNDHRIPINQLGVAICGYIKYIQILPHMASTAACLMSLQVCSKSIEDSTRSQKSSRTSGIPEEYHLQGEKTQPPAME